MMEKIIYGLFWYIPNEKYENNKVCLWNKDLISESGAEPAGETDCDVDKESVVATEGNNESNFEPNTPTVPN